MQMLFLMPVDISLVEASPPDTSTKMNAIIIEILICRLIIYSGCSCCYSCRCYYYHTNSANIDDFYYLLSYRLDINR